MPNPFKVGDRVRINFSGLPHFHDKIVTVVQLGSTRGEFLDSAFTFEADPEQREYTGQPRIWAYTGNAELVDRDSSCLDGDHLDDHLKAYLSEAEILYRLGYGLGRKDKLLSNELKRNGRYPQALMDGWLRGHEDRTGAKPNEDTPRIEKPRRRLRI